MASECWLSIKVALLSWVWRRTRAPTRSRVETFYPGLAYFNEVNRGAHFAAWEEPELLSAEVRAAFSGDARIVKLS